MNSIHFWRMIKSLQKVICAFIVFELINITTEFLKSIKTVCLQLFLTLKKSFDQGTMLWPVSSQEQFCRLKLNKQRCGQRDQIKELPVAGSLLFIFFKAVHQIW